MLLNVEANRNTRESTYMDKQEFCNQMKEILEMDQVSPENVLRDFEAWDSLAVLSVLAMADSKYGATIQAEDIRSVVTVSDLADLIESKRK